MADGQASAAAQDGWPRGANGITAIAFDVGETLVDETRVWTAQAGRVGVSTFTLFGAIGALIERGMDHRQVWTLLGVEPPGSPEPFDRDDLYPDVLPSLKALHRAGYRLAIVGNQPVAAADFLASMELPVELIATSDGWGVSKPSAEFFRRLCAELDCPPTSVAYVGDRLDNDVLPALSAGLLSVFIRRGPWGYLHAHRTEADLADLRIDRLDELVALFC